MWHVTGSLRIMPSITAHAKLGLGQPLTWPTSLVGLQLFYNQGPSRYRLLHPRCGRSVVAAVSVESGLCAQHLPLLRRSLQAQSLQLERAAQLAERAALCGGTLQALVCKQRERRAGRERNRGSGGADEPGNRLASRSRRAASLTRQRQHSAQLRMREAQLLLLLALLQPALFTHMPTPALRPCQRGRP